MLQKRGLGKGIDALFPPALTEVVSAPAPAADLAIGADVPAAGVMDGLRTVSIDLIIPNRAQPRTVFDEEKLRELADSIKEQGIIQPLCVTPLPDGRFELIAGERRLRASRLAGLTAVPVVIKTVDDEKLIALSIIENIQREDLNAIEEARAYSELMSTYSYTQEVVAQKVGKSRVAIANSLRLLKLPQQMQEDVTNGRYSAGHARAILSVDGEANQLKLRDRILKETPSVRDVEKMVQSYGVSVKSSSKNRVSLSPQINEVQERLKGALGTKVQIMPKGDGGRLVIDYYTPQDLDRLYRRITG